MDRSPWPQGEPAAFFALGVRPTERDSYPALHQADYDFADAAIAHGVALHVELVRRFWRYGGALVSK